MRVLILGAGIVGSTLAEQLSKEKHDIYVIDQDEHIIRDLNDNFDVFAMCGSGTSQQTLESIGIHDMDLMIAVTSNDEVNILGCMMASSYGVKKLVARVKSPEFASQESILTKENVGIDLFINSTNIVVEMIAKLIEVPGCNDVANIGDGESQIRGFQLSADCKMVGHTIGELQAQLKEDAFSIIAVNKDSKTFVPDDRVELAENDSILVFLASHSLPMFLPLLNRRIDETRKIVLFGASPASIELAMRMENQYEQVILIEPNEEKCNAVTMRLKGTLIIQGSALEKGTLEEVGIETVDVFACLSEKDEDNYMAALMARQYGAKRTVVLTAKPTYLEILDKSDIDVVINPRLITVGKILQFLRRGKILSATKLMMGEAEVLEYLVEEDSPIVGKNLKKLKNKKLLPENSNIASIRVDGVTMIPEDDAIIQAGQSVVVFTLPDALEQVENLMHGKKWNF